MTTKDYRALAAALSAAMHETLADREQRPEWQGNRRGGIALAARTLADTLSQDNPAFDRARFLAAAGVS